MVTVQPAEPEQSPDQPANTEPAVGAAVSVTGVLDAKLAAQVAPQLMPTGALVTVPVPPPWTITVSVNITGSKVAMTVVAETGVTIHVPVPVQPPPDQPAKVEPAAAVAVRITGLPEGKLAEHVVPHEIPTGA